MSREPEADDLRALAGRLTTVRVGRVHEHHGTIASTNDRALEWLGAGGPDGALVTADAQTAGRGRLGRPWQSPPGQDLYASVMLRPGAPAEHFGAIALAVGLGLHVGLERALGEQPGLRLKWPNDLLLDGRKLGGILCESRWRGQALELVVGFGINVHRRVEDFAPELRERATSLAIALGPDAVLGRAPILAALLYELERTLDRFFALGFGGIRRAYEQRCVTLGRAVEVEETSGERVPAIAVELDRDGALIARPREGGPSFRVQSADVWLAKD